MRRVLGYAFRLPFCAADETPEGGEGDGQLTTGTPGQRQFLDLFAQDNQ